MVLTPKNPISQADGRVDNDVWLIGEFLFYMSKNLSKVDMVDMIVDKFKTVDFPLHFLIV
jgi:hypothetical protein